MCAAGQPTLRSAKIDAAALVGSRILVVGNDDAEAISIIQGTISRVDRNAPEYSGSYSDFNINYYQASMNLSSGISGSPAIAEDGCVVGMVSGGLVNGESICYLLPLWPLLKTLGYLRRSERVPRGDIHCRFSTTPFHECRRLELSSERERQLRRDVTATRGLLVVETVLAGPASGKVMVADILLTVNGATVTHPVALEAIFDENVGGTVEI
ncbi:MAG: trypsin-like peptidase domain-containing protein, partial [Candidatus Binatia bacterium]